MVHLTAIFNQWYVLYISQVYKNKIIISQSEQHVTLLATPVTWSETVEAIRKLYEQLLRDKICSEKDFKWLYRTRFYWNKGEKDVLKKLQICIS